VVELKRWREIRKKLVPRHMKMGLLSSMLMVVLVLYLSL
jgi:hypothetical protein